MSTIGSRITSIRKAKKITQEKLAKSAGVDYNTLRKVETGKTKNPGSEFIEKISLALSVTTDQLIEQPKPEVKGGDMLPFMQLPHGNFEKMILTILQSDNGRYTDIEPFGGRGDKNRDILAVEIIGQKPAASKTLFQAKRHEKTTYTTLEDELIGIKTHFFDQPNPATPIEKIVFCLADTPSPTIKDKLKLFARENNLPEPIFWDARTIDVMCKRSNQIINEFFGGHIVEAIEGVSQVMTEVLNIKEMVQKNTSSTKPDSTLTSVSSKGDAQMQKARRLIGEKKYSEAKDILLTIKETVENSSDHERLKKLYNNLGLCLSKENNSESLKQSLDYLYMAIDLKVAKQNLIEVIINKEVKDKYDDALKYAQELLAEEPDNLDYAALYIHALNAKDKMPDAKKFIETDKKIKNRIQENEALSVAVSLVYFILQEVEKASLYVDNALEIFPESWRLNRFKGTALMLEAEKGMLSRDIDIMPFLKTNLVEKAVEHFEKSLDLAINDGAPEFMHNQIRLCIYSAMISLRRGQSSKFKDAYLKTLEKSIDDGQLSETESKAKVVAKISQMLECERNFETAYTIFKEEIVEKYNATYKTILDMAHKFFQHGAPEYSIKLLEPLHDEAKENNDFEYWAVLSTCHALLNDKNSALRTMNEAQKHFSSLTDIELKRRILSHYSALTARYHDNSEAERMFRSMTELQNITPEETIVQPIEALTSDGHLTQEMKDFFENNKKDFIKKKEKFVNTPIPVYFLERIFSRNFPEALEIPRNNYDFEFVIHYNALDKEFLHRQVEILEKNDTFVIDYSALLNFSRTGQLGLFSALGKKVLASEYLLFQVQQDLMVSENHTLRNAWNFLRGGNVQLFPYIEIEKGALPKLIKDFFSEWMPWFAQEIVYCLKNKTPLITDDLRMLSYLNSEEVGLASINSFIFFQTGLITGALDKKQYSLVLGDLADMFYHFIAFNGEDLLHIVADDTNKIRNGSTQDWMSFKEHGENFKVSRRAYHLLNQVHLPGSEVTSFLAVSLDFLERLIKLSFTEDEKMDWVLFMTNFYGGFLSEENFNTQREQFTVHLEFVIRAWVLIFQSLPKNRPDILKKAGKIKYEHLRLAIENSLRKGMEL